MKKAAWYLFLCLLAACGRDSEKPSTPPIVIAPPAAASPAARSPGDTTTSCGHTGLWAICSVERRLKQAGFVAKRVTERSPASRGLSVTPIVYTLGHARLEIFLYADEASMARDVARMDTTGVSLIRSGNLAAVYVGDNPQQAERLSLALTAGAPQPGSPR